MKLLPNLSLALLALVLNAPVLADGTSIDKVYHPYVQPLEREVELRMISANGEEKYRLGLGKSLSDRLFIEGYLITTNTNSDNLDFDAYEIELKYQLTEQGEYSADWGVIAELEKAHSNDIWEAKAGLISVKEWGRWVGTANFLVIYEWGDLIKNEIESSLALQARYRYSRFFEPAIELYSSQNTRGLGPVVMGDIKLSGRKKLHWEAGAILGLDTKTADNTWRLLTEFEF